MASKPRRCELFLLIIIFVISQMHVSLLEKRGAWVWLSRCGFHAAGHQPVRKKPKGKNGNPPQYRSAQRCCATNIEFKIWQVIIYRDRECCKETYLRVACMCFLPHLVYFFGGGAFLCSEGIGDFWNRRHFISPPTDALAELLANRNAQYARGTAKSNQCLQTIYFRLPHRPCRPCHSWHVSCLLPKKKKNAHPWRISSFVAHWAAVV